MITTSEVRKLAMRVLHVSTVLRPDPVWKNVVIWPSCWYASAPSMRSIERSLRVIW